MTGNGFSAQWQTANTTGSRAAVSHRANRPTSDSV